LISPHQVPARITRPLQPAINSVNTKLSYVKKNFYHLAARAAIRPESINMPLLRHSPPFWPPGGFALKIYRDPEHPSHLPLPVIAQELQPKRFEAESRELGSSFNCKFLWTGADKVPYNEDERG